MVDGYEDNTFSPLKLADAANTIVHKHMETFTHSILCDDIQLCFSPPDKVVLCDDIQMFFFSYW